MKTETEIRQMLTIIGALGKNLKAVEALQWVLDEHPSEIAGRATELERKAAEAQTVVEEQSA